MKHIQKLSLVLSIAACFLYGLDGIFQLDLLAGLSLKLPAVSTILKVLFAAAGMINILLYPVIAESE